MRSRARCSWCGEAALPDRATCSDECAEHVLQQTHEAFAIRSSERMRRMAEADLHPAFTPEANERRRQTRLRNHAADVAWEREHPEPFDHSIFEREILPGLQELSARQIAKATGLSVSHCADIKRGERIPHPRWWEKLTIIRDVEATA